MNTTAPSKGKIIWMILFAASCVGLLLFLWISFGGSVPLSPQGYRVAVEFPQATQLGSQSDVDIAGVKVGTVISVKLDRRTGLSRAVLQIDPRYAPRPANTRAVLRTKSLLGETYVSLSFGDPNGAKLKDGATLPEAQVAPTVDLDQILDTFSPKTRQAFESWMQDDASAFSGQGQAFNTALASLAPFSSGVSNVLNVLERDQKATKALLSNGNKVLTAVSQNPAALQGLVRNANTVFSDTAARNQELAQAVRNFPAFLQSTRATVNDVTSFSEHTMPLINELEPAAKPLSNALISLSKLSPALKTVMVGLGPLTAAADSGIPALEQLSNVSSKPPAGSLKAVLPSVTSWLGNIVPVINYVDKYRRELAAFFANGAASTQGSTNSFSAGPYLHYLRSSAVLNPEGLTAYAHRTSANRNNPYTVPGGGKSLKLGPNHPLHVFGKYLCTTTPAPTVPASASTWNNFSSQTTSTSSTTATSTTPTSTGPTEGQILDKNVYGGAGSDPKNIPAPGCVSQRALAEATTPNRGGLTQTFPDLKPLR